MAKNHCSSMKYTIYSILYDKYKQLLMSRFVWNDLPFGMEAKHIESILFENGDIAFFFDDTLGYLALPCNIKGFNVYHEATSYFVHGNNYSRELSLNDSVRIKNNYLATPSSKFVSEICENIAEIDATIKVNVVNQKTPYIILTNKSNELTMKNLYNSMNQNQQAIFINKSTMESLQESLIVKDTKVDFVSNDLMILREKYEAMLLTHCGINNVNYEKKERLIVDEVNANNEHIHGNLDIMLETRQNACKLINEKYGLNISVEIREHVEKDSRLNEE